MSVQLDRHSKAKKKVLEKRRWLHIVHFYRMGFVGSLETVLVNYIIQVSTSGEKTSIPKFRHYYSHNILGIDMT